MYRFMLNNPNKIFLANGDINQLPSVSEDLDKNKI